jgi:hypothetical protein
VYKIEDENRTEPNSAANNPVRYPIKDLNPVTTYMAQIRAYRDYGERDGSGNPIYTYSPYSTAAIFTTTGPAPRNLREVSGSRTATRVELTWDNPTGASVSNGFLGIKGWQINKDGEPYAYIPFNQSVRTWQDNKMVPGLTVRYTMQALWAWEGDPVTGTGSKPGNISNAINVTPTGGTVSGVRAVPAVPGQPNPKPTSIAVDWNAIASASIPSGMSVKGYNVHLYLGGERIENKSERVRADEVRRVAFEELRPNTLYQVRVAPVWDIGLDGTEGRLSTAVNIRTTNPNTGAPVPVSASTTAKQVTLGWNRLDGAAGYRVLKNGVEYGDFITQEEFKEGVEGQNTWKDNNIERPGTAIRYAVRVYWPVSVPAENPEDWMPGAVSAVRSVTPPGPAPTGLAIVRGTGANPTNTRVNLTWNLSTNPNNADVTGFLITKMIGAIVIDEIVVLRESMANRFEWTDDKLNPGIAVRYRVQSLWGTHDLDDGKYVRGSGKPGNMSGILTVQPTGGAAPRNVRVVSRTLTGTGVTLTWNDPANNTDNRLEIVGWQISKNGNPVDYITYDGFISNGRWWRDDTLHPGVRVQYTVQAVWNIDINRPGRISNRLNVTPRGAAPARVQARVNSPTQVTVTWNAVPNVTDAEVSGYRVRIFTPATRTEPAVEVGEINVPAGQRSAEFKNLGPNTQYRANVTVLWNDDNLETALVGRVSSNVNVRTTGPAPTGLRIQNVRTTSAQLRWNHVPGAEGYRIIRTAAGTVGTTTRDMAAPQNSNMPVVWTDTGLTPGAQVRYTVQALWGNNPGRPTSVIRVTPLRL